jgi:hypothetical protein
MSSRPAILNGGRENQGKQANGDSFQGIMQKFFKTVSAEDHYRYDVTSCEHVNCELCNCELCNCVQSSFVINTVILNYFRIPKHS